jgi:preprotein translocase subunit SecE
VNEELKVQNAGGADTARLVVAVVLVIGGIAAFYMLDTAPTLVRWGAVVAGLVLGIGAIATSAYGRAVIQFVLDSRVELRKIVWPERRETGMTTLVVLAFVIIGGVFFWLVDLILAALTRHLTGQGG